MFSPSHCEGASGSMCGTLEPCSADTVHARPDRATIPPYRCCGEPDAHADARDATRHTPRRAPGERQCTPRYTVRADTAHRCAFVSLSETVGGTLTSHVIS